jgi:hypothetical protein
MKPGSVKPTMDCWNDYSRTLPSGAKHSVKHREALTEFLHVNEGTVRRYMSGGTIQGEPLIRLRVFLSLKGYKVLELERLDSLQRELVELVSFDVITLDMFVNAMGYNSTSAALVLLRGDSRLILKEKRDIAIMLLELHKDDLMAAKELWYERLGIEEKSSSRIHTQAAVAASNSSVHKNDKASDDEIIFIGLVKALEPIAARIVESATPEDRKRLREKVGSKEFFGLSTNFNRLCSEAANTQYAGRTRDEHSHKH